MRSPHLACHGIFTHSSSYAQRCKLPGSPSSCCKSQHETKYIQGLIWAQGVLNSQNVESITRPALLLSSANGKLDATRIEREIQQFTIIDDVYTTDFHDFLVVQVPHEVELNLEELTDDFGCLTKLEFRRVLCSTVDSEENLLPSGPYFLQGQNLHQAWKLYDDSLGAFIQTVVPDNVTVPKR